MIRPVKKHVSQKHLSPKRLSGGSGRRLLPRKLTPPALRRAAAVLRRLSVACGLPTKRSAIGCDKNWPRIFRPRPVCSGRTTEGYQAPIQMGQDQCPPRQVLPDEFRFVCIRIAPVAVLPRLLAPRVRERACVDPSPG